MPGRACLSDFFAFTARSAQITKNSPPDEQRRKAIYDPQFSQERPRGSPPTVLPDWFPRLTDRSRLRRSTIVRGFSHHLLHGLGSGIFLCRRDRRRDPRL